MAAVMLHSKRFLYVMNSFGNATDAFLKDISPVDYGWMIIEIDGEKQIVPHWDSDKSKEEINFIRKSFLRKCSCTKGCKNKKCSCVKANGVCSNLCTCINCDNTAEKKAEKMNVENGDFVLDECAKLVDEVDCAEENSSGYTNEFRGVHDKQYDDDEDDEDDDDDDEDDDESDEEDESEEENDGEGNEELNESDENSESGELDGECVV